MDAKCKIINLDNRAEVEASISPSEIVYEKHVPWQRHKRSTGDNPLLEFKRAEAARLYVELTFDVSGDSKANVYESHVKVLEQMTLVDKRTGDLEDKRPPLCHFSWGDAFPKFKGVIENLSVRYEQFREDGSPERALCSITMRQAGSVKAAVGPRRKADSAEVNRPETI